MRLILFIVLALISVSQTATARSYTCEMQSAMLYEAEGEPKKMAGDTLPTENVFLTVNKDTLAVSLPNQAPQIFNLLSKEDLGGGYWAHYSSDTVYMVNSVLLSNDNRAKKLDVTMFAGKSDFVTMLVLLCPH